MIAYFDTSALVPLLVDEAGSGVASETWMAAARVVSCDVCEPELHAAIAAAFRSGRLLDVDEDAARSSADGVVAQLTTVRTSEQLLRSAAESAWRHGLRGYDAVHLAAALSAPVDVLVAGDGSLLTSARDEGLAVVDTADVG